MSMEGAEGAYKASGQSAEVEQVVEGILEPRAFANFGDYWVAEHAAQARAADELQAQVIQGSDVQPQATQHEAGLGPELDVEPER